MFDAKACNEAAASARSARAQLGKLPCCCCGMNYARRSRAFDRERGVCVNRTACHKRVAAALAGSGRYSPRSAGAVDSDYRVAVAGHAG